MKITYNPKGVCSEQMEIEIEDNIISDLRVQGGCNGNLQGVRALIIGMEVSEVISRLRGIHCGGKGTSCPDQLARALESL